MPVIRHGRLKEPSLDETIWRYLSLSKFKDLLATSELFLCRLDKFPSDELDGAVPSANYNPRALRTVHNVEIILEEITRDGKVTIQNNSRKKSVPLTEYYSKSDFEASVKNEAARDEHNRKSMFASCWHKNTDESSVFWDFVNSSPSVAIKSSVRNLRNAVFQNMEHLYLFDVEYFDDGQSIPSQNAFYQVGYKRRQFKFENEVRLVFWCHQTTNREKQPSESKRVKVDVNELVSEVWLPPLSDDNYFSEVYELIRRFNLNVELKNSKL